MSSRVVLAVPRPPRVMLASASDRVDRSTGPAKRLLKLVWLTVTMAVRA